jgi:hypothetical protein
LVFGPPSAAAWCYLEKEEFLVSETIKQIKEICELQEKKQISEIYALHKIEKLLKEKNHVF